MAADPSDLTDLATVESFLAMPSGNADEPLLQTLITGVSGEIATYCERESFAAQTGIVETRNGNGRWKLGLLRPPVFSVASLVIDTFTIQQAPDALSAGWVLDTDIGPPPIAFLAIRGLPPTSVASIAFFGPLRFLKGYQNVVITYSSGYNTPGQIKLSQTVPGAPAFPNDLKLAATELVAMRYRQSKRWGDTSMGEGPTRLTYFTGALPAMTQLKLDRHKLVAIPEV